jgi:hypothetical protein
MSSPMHPGFSSYPTTYQNISNTGKGKGKAREIDFDNAFAQASASFAEPISQSGLREVDDSEDLAASMDSVKIDQENSLHGQSM